jgi:predicted AlkP superfamily pyrophosphatase or phosphodiesterase
MLRRRLHRFLLATCVATLVATLGLAAQTLQVIHTDHGPNSAQAQKQHYVVLVSLDGFRWDYARKYGAAHLLALGKQGASAPQGMIPSYPSLTFSNHYAIVTGLYPEHNGLVRNNFFDPSRQAAGKLATYSIGNPAAVTDGSWYSGHPALVPRRKPGHAHRLPLLARI